MGFFGAALLLLSATAMLAKARSVPDEAELVAKREAGVTIKLALPQMDGPPKLPEMPKMPAPQISLSLPSPPAPGGRARRQLSVNVALPTPPKPKLPPPPKFSPPSIRLTLPTPGK